MSDELPSGTRSLGRALRMGYRAEPLLIVAAGATTVAAAVPDALFALGLAMLADAALAGDGRRIALAAAGLALLATASWLLTVLGDRVNRRLSDRAAVPIESHVVRLQASVATIAHHERPDYRDRLSLLRDHPAALSELYQSLFGTAGALVRLVITLALLMAVHPALGLLGVFAVPAVLVSNRRAGIETATEEAGAPHDRLARHLFLLGTTAPAGKEVRVAGVRQRLRDERRAAWRRRHVPLARARWASAAWQSATLLLFGAAFVAAVGYVALPGTSSAGQVMLVLAAGSRLAAYVGQAVQSTHFFRAIWLEVSRRLTWLEDYARANAATAELPGPDRLRQGIRLENVSFRYPGTAADRFVLREVSMDLPAGAVVAVVGENGAGKSSLVKLLCRCYEPTTGRITVDGVDLARISPQRWRSRLAGAFQDFFRFEYPVQQAVGVGDLPRIDDRSAVLAALTRAGAEGVVSGLPAGLATQLGVTWHEGVELSHGQWQKLALARGFLRDDPLLLVLDEPTSALDAETEHALFSRYAAAARSAAGSGSGRITILVSHRFSTVRAADLIVVLDGARVVECGSHEELLSRGGHYAQLHAIQARAYTP